MLNTRHVAELIERAELTQVREAIEKSLSAGSQTFEQSLLQMIREGVIDEPEALAHADSASNLYWPSGPNDFMPSLPVFIFNYAVSPYEDWHRQAWAAALVLLTVVMLLNFGVRLLAGKRALLTSQAG